MNVYGFDNYKGDKGIIIADSNEEAIKIYSKTYNNKITEDWSEYVKGGCMLTDHGLVQKCQMYVNVSW